MEPGERDRLVTIQTMAQGTAGSGFPIETPTTLATVWMRKLDAQGRERLTADQIAARGDTQWEMGYREDMDPDLVDVPKARWLLYQGRRYDIVAASQIGRREGVELMTIAHVG